MSKSVIKDYNIWSNFTYFISGIYAIIVPFIVRGGIGPVYTGLFILAGILIILDGVISCVYHHHTPSYKSDESQKHREEYKILCDSDRYLAITSATLSVVLLLMRIYAGKLMVILRDPTFYLTILFIIIGFVFYFLARQSENSIETCSSSKCKIHNMDSYDIFHSNWHLFTGISILFGLTTLKHTFEK